MSAQARSLAGVEFIRCGALWSAEEAWSPEAHALPGSSCWIHWWLSWWQLLLEFVCLLRRCYSPKMSAAIIGKSRSRSVDFVKAWLTKQFHKHPGRAPLWPHISHQRWSPGWRPWRSSFPGVRDPRSWFRLGVGTMLDVSIFADFRTALLNWHPTVISSPFV